MKGIDLKYAYMNKTGKYYGDLPDNYDVEGRLVGEMPIIHAEHQDAIHVFNNTVINSNKIVHCMINTKYGGNNKYVHP